MHPLIGEQETDPNEYDISLPVALPDTANCVMGFGDEPDPSAATDPQPEPTEAIQNEIAQDIVEPDAEDDAAPLKGVDVTVGVDAQAEQQAVDTEDVTEPVGEEMEEHGQADDNEY